MSKKIEWEKYNGLIIPTFEDAGIEFDQRMLNAIQKPINSIASYLKSVNARWYDKLPDLRPCKETELKPLSQISLSSDTVRNVVDAAIPYIKANVFGTKDYLRGLIELTKSVNIRPGYIQDIAFSLTGDSSTDISTNLKWQSILKSIENSLDGSDDFQYVFSLEEDRISFRIVSTIDDYICKGDSGLLIPNRALLTNLCNIGLFTINQVGEFEDLINNSKASENDIQKFFEKNPHFLYRWDHRNIFPHIYLTKYDDGPLIPDFILTNVETQDAAILELKKSILPKNKSFIRNQKNRIRFADIVQEACAQLRTYKKWFDISKNRKMLKEFVGMEIYSPRLMVVVGRSNEFRDEVERASLRSSIPDVEIVTYDDIYSYAKKRMVNIKGDT